LKWFDLTRHGYMLLDLNPNRAQCDWFMVDTILARSEKESFAFGAVHACGSNVTIAEMPAPGKPLQDASTPVEPPVTAVEGDHTQPSPLTILGHGANPASTAMYVTFVVERSGPVHARLVGTDGSVVRESSIDGVKAGLNTWSLDLHDVASGSYQLSLEQDGAMATMTVVIQR
jgi:alkaline phosphatase D